MVAPGTALGKGVWMMRAGDQILSTVRRYIGDLEQRVEQQKALIERLAGSGQDTAAATHTLRALMTTLALTREHLEFQVNAQARRKSAEALVATPAGC